METEGLNPFAINTVTLPSAAGAPFRLDFTEIVQYPGFTVNVIGIEPLPAFIWSGPGPLLKNMVWSRAAISEVVKGQPARLVPPPPRSMVNVPSSPSPVQGLKQADNTSKKIPNNAVIKKFLLYE